jgi:DNA polymerase-4
MKSDSGTGDTGKKRKIIHIDMDAFFAAVEQRDHPHLKGKPVVVGGDPAHRGVVSAASYEAREYGIHSAMPAVVARRKCPHAVFIRPSFSRYREVSDSIMEIARSYTPLVEQLSLDECFCDVTGSMRLFGDAVHIARSIKRKIFEREHLTASAGVASNKFLAKIASDLEKPDGFVVVEEREEAVFLKDIPVEKIWGIGKVMSSYLHSLGIQTVGQLAELSLDFLRLKFGKQGTMLYSLSRGQDESPVTPCSEAKSIGHEETYGKDLFSWEEMTKRILILSEAVGFRLRQRHLACRTITLKVRYPDFSTRTRSRTFNVKVNDDLVLFYNAVDLLEKTDARRKGVRLLGVQTSNLSHPDVMTQTTLFFQNTSDKKRELSKAIDAIRLRYGKDSIVRARARS